MEQQKDNSDPRRVGGGRGEVPFGWRSTSVSQMRLDSGRLCGSVGELKKGISRAEKSRAERDAVRSGRA